MIIVTGEVRFGDGEIARLKPLFERVIAASRAEPGCARYAYAVDLADGNLLRVVEEWADEAAVDAHMQSPVLAELMGALMGAKLETASINAYEGHFLRALLGGAAEPAD